MSDSNFDDETLMAFADGELDEETRLAVERAMETDDTLVDRVAVFARTGVLSKQAIGPLSAEPVPEALLADVKAMVEESARAEAENATQDENVIQLAATPRTPWQASSSRWALPLAASVAVVIGGLAGFYLANMPGDGAPDGLRIAQFDQPGLIDALRTVPSGSDITLSRTGDRMRLIATFRDSEDALCREFEVDRSDRSTFVSVACRMDDTWEVRFAVAAASGSSDGYAPASSLESLDAYLSAIGAGQPLSEADEKTALTALQ
ncbi:MAG: anti-sigma factor [Alphaproteobacteria bacterium]|nr:anti-sigma factor [Alphaproteobacteria bacterium]